MNRQWISGWLTAVLVVASTRVNTGQPPGEPPRYQGSNGCIDCHSRAPAETNNPQLRRLNQDLLKFISKTEARQWTERDKHSQAFTLLKTPLGQEICRRLGIAENDIDLLVMGGYGTPSLKQKIFGGVTRTILSSMIIPVIMSH